eukprot:gnl/Spiro4/16314_TR8760_c0_g1_i1.p1 gnl/Spiro4/16314_TR8760_c0_g1~~gnl/Spiro4/16314_TR8760_c0_g1_i1.p1  ORF type:complete len:276 (-),score=87.48 gnl/Spiro4/16314_TR8760_c0_g1_i1:224-1051(-)
MSRLNKDICERARALDANLRQQTVALKRLNKLQKKLQRLDAARRPAPPTSLQNAAHKKGTSTSGASKLAELGFSLDSMQDLLKNSKELCEAVTSGTEQEIATLATLIESVSGICESFEREQQAAQMPHKRRRLNEREPPALAPEHAPVVASEEEKVAAFCTPSGSSGPSWILAVVVRYSRPKQKYLVRDSDPDTAEQHELADANVVMLSSRVSVAPGTRVYALFEGTTVFYPATVRSGPKRKTNPVYVVRFDDDEDPAKEVLAENIFVPPPHHSL